MPTLNIIFLTLNHSSECVFNVTRRGHTFASADGSLRTENIGVRAFEKSGHGARIYPMDIRGSRISGYPRFTASDLRGRFGDIARAHRVRQKFHRPNGSRSGKSAKVCTYAYGTYTTISVRHPRILCGPGGKYVDLRATPTIDACVVSLSLSLSSLLVPSSSAASPSFRFVSPLRCAHLALHAHLSRRLLLYSPAFAL